MDTLLTLLKDSTLSPILCIGEWPSWPGLFIMAVMDMPFEQLKVYLPQREEPADFDTFWQQTLTEARSFPLDARFEPVDAGLETVEVFDVTLNGYGGQPIKGWFLLPAKREGKLPCVVEYIGYGGGRGLPIERLLWSSAGYAHLIMDTRGQGGNWQRGDTGDVEPEGTGPSMAGVLTRGVLSPQTYYYRRLFTDAVRAVDVARAHPAVDSGQVIAVGGSQGGGIALAVSGLVPDLQYVMPDVPFLCHYRRAVDLVDTLPYFELARFLVTHYDQVDTIFNTLSYFDGVNFAARAKATALFSVGLHDDICPPSTVYAAYNHYLGPKEIRVWAYSDHRGGGPYQAVEQIKFLRRHLGNT